MREGCPYGDMSHHYTTVATEHYAVLGRENKLLDRTRVYVVCTKCGHYIQLKEKP